MKTRERILRASLTLFNEEGESNVSTVDIADVLDISPGNLYYHFKGKEPIIAELFDQFEREINQVLKAPIKKALAIEDNWVFFYILFEEIYDFRFFYRNITSLTEQYPKLATQFRKLIRSKRQTIASILDTLRKVGFLEMTPEECILLAERCTVHVTYWPSYQELVSPKLTTGEAIHAGVHTLIGQIAPYLPEGRQEFLALIDEFYSNTQE